MGFRGMMGGMKTAMRTQALVLGLVLGGLTHATALNPGPDGQGANWVLEKDVIGAGGGFSVGGSYLLQGTAGQTVTGLAAGNTYLLRSGFWGERPDVPFADVIFADDFE